MKAMKQQLLRGETCRLDDTYQLSLITKADIDDTNQTFKPRYEQAI